MKRIEITKLDSLAIHIGDQVLHVTDAEAREIQRQLSVIFAQELRAQVQRSQGVLGVLEPIDTEGGAI